jgi:hypothetical protein
MNIACFQFATGSLHFVASIETLLLDQSNKNKTYYRFWAHQTSYPNRMAMNFNGVTGKYPKKFNHIFSFLNFEISKNLEEPNLKAKKQGNKEFFIQNAKVLLNDGQGSEAKITDSNLVLGIVDKVEPSKLPTIKDNDSPELFLPEVAKDSNIFNGKYFVVPGIVTFCL